MIEVTVTNTGCMPLPYSSNEEVQAAGALASPMNVELKQMGRTSFAGKPDLGGEFKPCDRRISRGATAGGPI